MLRDALVATVAKLIQWTLGLLGFILIVAGLISGHAWLIIPALVCFAGTFGVRYALGHVVRIR